MALSNLTIVLALILMGMTYTECKYPRCYPLKIEVCRSRYKNSTNLCYDHDKIIDCLNDFIDDCNDKDRMYAMEKLKLSEKEKNQCPGLQPGTCILYERSHCLMGLSYAHLYGKIEEKICKEVDKRGDAAQKCLNGLKKYCTDKEVLDRIFGFWLDIGQRKADCKFYRKYEWN